MKSDLHLILATKKGSSDAFGELFERYHSPLLMYIGKRNDAKDLLQETFNKAYHKIHTFNESYSFKCWLYKIARNCIIDASRKDTRHQTFLLDVIPFLKSNTESPYAAQLVKDEYRMLVREAIDDLSEMQREVLIMSYYHNLTYVQIAEILECSLSAVKTHMSRAVLKLSHTLPKPEKGDR
ncbi:MAG: RNA polymerase sigma factor [Lentisphaeraceae bacterium]|nr:RNA polymerase sigma factor [Lentisphaeraceae bacterium]